LRPIAGRTRGLLPLCQLSLLRAAALLSRPVEYRGLGTLARLLGTRLFDPEHSVILPIHRRSLFRVLLRDHYWISLLDGRWRYEPEIEAVLDALLHGDAAFFDCGANKGYWSLFAAERIGDPAHVIALEGGPTTYRQLVGNAELNDASFTALNLAVTDGHTATVRFTDDPQFHAGAAIVGDSATGTGAANIVEVPAMSIDRIVETHPATAGATPLVIKLDVEGAEIEAMQGAARALSRPETLLIFEDHGNDPECRHSRFAAEEIGLALFVWQHDRIVPMQSFDQLRAIKTDPTIGYNVFACQPGSPLAGRLPEIAARR
jgi:FkbM family methyltransferase